MQISEKELQYRKRLYYQNLNIQDLNKKIDKLEKQLALDEQQLNSKSWKIINGVRGSLFKTRHYIKKQISKVSGKEKRKESSYKAFDYFPLKLTYEEDDIIAELGTDIKALAFYFPKKTPKLKEISWDQITEANPKARNHYQPRIPHKDFGFYNNGVSILEKQAKSARDHGIYGFCYKYDFGYKNSNELLKEMLHSEIKMPYVLCMDINKKELEKKNSIKRLAEEILPFLQDKRYIKQARKPILLLYNPSVFTTFEESIQKLRTNLKKMGVEQILIWQNKGINDVDQSYIETIDGEFQYRLEETNLCKKDPFNLYDYHQLILDSKKLYRNHMTIVPYYYSCSLPFDNTPIQKDKPVIDYNFSKADFYFLINEILRQTRDTHDIDDRFMLVHSWNDWAEGTNLEPDQKRGYSYLNTFTKALYGLPLTEKYLILNENSPKQLQLNKKIAVQIHLFYIDLIDELKSYLANIPYTFDCFISTDTSLKKEIIETRFRNINNCQKIVVEVFENRGRDILPFLLQMKNQAQNYDYICHIHTKKTVTNNHGERWRHYLYENLFGSKEHIQRIFYQFETNRQLGMIFPCIYSDVINDCTLVGNEKGITLLKEKLNISKSLKKEETLFPAGSMFWCKKEALIDLFELGLTKENFPKEKRQVDATLAHAIERMFCVIAEHNGYQSLQIVKGTIHKSGDEI